MDMKQQRKKAVKFTDLEAWQYGHALTLDVYRTTQEWPKEEIYGLASQIRRAAVSNLAEGFSRSTKVDKGRFYTMAHGSLTEVQNQLLVARDLQYVPTSVFQAMADKAIVTHKLITGLIKSLKD